MISPSDHLSAGALRALAEDTEQKVEYCVTHSQFEGDVLHQQVIEILETFAREVVARCAQENTWQPIETAPKDADVVLLYQHGAGVQPGYWDTLHDLGWVAVETQGLTGGRMQPTHWMPLP